MAEMTDTPTKFLVGETSDRRRVFAESDEIDDELEVWVEDDPDTRTTVVALEDALGEGGVAWYAEPIAAAPDGDADVIVEGDTPSEAAVAALDSLDLDDLEDQVAVLEQWVAEQMIDDLDDARFDDEPQAARVAAATKRARAHQMAAVVAALGDDDGDAPDGEGDDDEGDEGEVSAAVDPEDPADADDEERLEALRRRVAKLEKSLTDYLADHTPDAELDEPDNPDSATVDERPAVMGQVER